MTQFDILFLDIGGVLLTNGWDHQERENAAKRFNLDWEDFDQRHHEFYNLHEKDKISLDEYLQMVIFWKERDFTLQQFRDFIFAQSKPFPDMLELMKEVKQKWDLRIAAVSNEGRDLADFRIKTFHLDQFIDDFFISCYVGYQKPDPHIYRQALDVLQVKPNQVVYLDDRPNLVQAAAQMGIHGFVHTDYKSTKKQLNQLFSS